MSRLIQALHSYLDLKPFSIQQSCSGVRVSHRVFDEDMFERLTSLTLSRHLSHTRGISLVGEDDGDVVAELSKSADEGNKGRWRGAECVFRQVKSDSLRSQCKSVNWQTFSWICADNFDKEGKKTKQKFKKTNAPVLRPTAGRGLVEHLCKHKTSSSALSGLQRNVSSEQALNQLCLALRGTLCWSHVGLSLIAHDRVATSQFFFLS